MNKIVSGILLNAFCLFFAFETNAQQFKIISAEDGAALPFATLINFTHPIIVSANANGIAELNAKNGDSIVVSYVGFKSNSFVFNSNSNQTIRLIKAIEILPPVLVQNCKKMKSFKYRNKNAVKFITNENGVRTDYAGLVWYKEFNVPTFAIKLNPEKENAILNSFSFWLEKSYLGLTTAIKAPIIINFYEVTDSTLPGNPIRENPLLYYPQKTGKQILNLDSLHIRIPPNGIYVSFQCVMNEEYEWKETFHFSDSANHIYTGYGGRIEGLFTKNLELVAFYPLKNKWIFVKSTSGQKGLNCTIKYEALIKYCED
jgi:hypothetical protein